jgi:hypothetical protein
MKTLEPVDRLMAELVKLKQQIHDTQVICEWARRELEKLRQEPHP